MRSRFAGGRIPRILVLLLLLGLGRRLFFGGGDGGNGGGSGGSAALLPGVDSAILVAVVGVLVVVGVVLAYRAGMFPWGNSESITQQPDGDYTCRYCGENLEHYRNRCPYCETRDPVGDPESR